MVDRPLEGPNEIREYLGRWAVTWVNVDGLGDGDILRRIAEVFRLHPLALEDVVHVHQRAKVELYSDYYFIVGRMVEKNERLETDQLSLFLGKNFVVTFQEWPGDDFDPVRQRIRKAGGNFRRLGPDYLAYALIDAFIDHYFPVLEKYGERLEVLEDNILSRPESDVISEIYEVRRELLALRRCAWPLRDAMSTLYREPSPFVSDETRLYLRDCYDHAVQIMDLLENYRETASSLTEVYLSSASNRLSEIMKVLTIFTTIFIPLSFIAGVYGMNFNTAASALNMPELNWYWGYPFALTLMAAVAGSMLLLFRKKGWLSSVRRKQGRPDRTQ
jgi:magnesium transporter